MAPDALSDISVVSHGSVWLFTPHSPAAVDLFSGELDFAVWQMIGDAYAVDHRPASHLVEQLREEGFTINE